MLRNARFVCEPLLEVQSSRQEVQYRTWRWIGAVDRGGARPSPMESRPG